LRTNTLKQGSDKGLGKRIKEGNLAERIDESTVKPRKIYESQIKFFIENPAMDLNFIFTNIILEIVFKCRSLIV